MTLDMGSPFKVSTEPYVIAAVAQAEPDAAPTEDVAQAQPAAEPAEDVAIAQTLPVTDQDETPGKTSPITFLIVVALIVGLVLLLRRGQAQKG
jgi:hypothetical protein